MEFGKEKKEKMQMQRVLSVVYGLAIGLFLVAVIAGAFGAFNGSPADRAYVRLVGDAAYADIIAE